MHWLVYHAAQGCDSAESLCVCERGSWREASGHRPGNTRDTQLLAAEKSELLGPAAVLGGPHGSRPVLFAAVHAAESSAPSTTSTGRRTSYPGECWERFSMEPFRPRSSLSTLVDPVQGVASTRMRGPGHVWPELG